MGESKKRGGLGFRDLESFNNAMLAKHIWRMQTYPDSLVSKIMREKYIKKMVIYWRHNLAIIHL